MTGTGDAYQLESFPSPVAFWRVFKGKQPKKGREGEPEWRKVLIFNESHHLDSETNLEQGEGA